MTFDSQSDTLSPFAEWFWKATGVLVAVAFVIGGGLTLFILLIAGLWEGFSRTEFVFLFLGGVIYVCAGIALSGYVAFRPSHAKGGILLLYLVPVLVFAWPKATDEQPAEWVHTYMTGTEAEAAEARDLLLERGRRAGGDRAVRTLLTYLEDPTNEETVLKTVKMLGELSYQYPPVLEALQTVRDTTRANPQQQILFDAAGEALLGVNPYLNPDQI
ncbi:MAG: hypothetical protein ACNA78_03745 [Balneolaceae bacterium]